MAATKNWLVVVAHDIGYALRAFRRSPGFTLVVLLTLGIGIGANTAVLSIANAVLWGPLPYQAAEELVSIRSTHAARGIERSELTWADIGFLRSNVEGLAAVAAYDDLGVNLVTGDLPQRLAAAKVTPNLFEVLGIRPIMGRGLGAGDDGEAVVVVSERLWRQVLGADPQILDRDLLLDGVPHRAVGVMPPAADLPLGAQAWVPFSRGDQQNKIDDQLGVIGRRAPGVGLGVVRAQAQALSALLAEEVPAYQGRELRIADLRTDRVGNLRPVILILLVVVASVLLIACSNIANMLLARDEQRRRDIAVRTALGATPRRIIGQLLTESLVLSLAGGALGLVLGHGAVRRLLHLVPVEIPPWIRFDLDVRILLGTFLISLVAMVAFGLVPARQAARQEVTDALRGNGSAAATSPRGRRLRNVLLTGEVAMSVVLLVGALLFVRSFFSLVKVDPGFSPESRIAFSLDILPDVEDEEEARSARLDEILARLEALPDVVSAGAVNALPLVPSGTTTDISAVGQSREEYEGNPFALYKSVSNGYFKTLEIDLVRGEGMSARSPGDQKVIINETLARVLWPGEDPVGMLLNLGEPSQNFGDWLAVLGVVADVKHFGLDQEVLPTLYMPYDIAPGGSMNFVVRVRGEPLVALPSLRHAIDEVAPGQPVYDVRSLEDLVERSLWQPRLFSLLFWGCALIALLLTAFGLYGAIAYSVSQRTREFGIHMALGADRWGLLRSVMGQGLRLASIGILCGLPLALGMAVGLRSLLFGVSAFDPLTFLAVVLMLFAVTGLACLIPARRATRVEPMTALRDE